MINWNIDPVLLSFWNLEIRYYGLIYVIGFLITFFYLDYLRKKEKLELRLNQINDLLFYLIIGVILGARIFEVLFWNPRYYFSNPLEILAIWNGGMSFHGGLIGVIFAALIFCKKNSLNVLKLLDILVIPGVFSLALGRIGNLLNSEIPGTITNVSWCFNFQNTGGCRHPYQIYAALKRFLVFGVLLMLNKKEHKNGYLFFISMLLLAIGRFALDFFREDLRYLGLSIGQYFSIAIVSIIAYILLKYYRKGY
ncbi:MAG: prolipoprotein diacylglyceryl transferase [Nanoarchaeota archaeon]